MGIDYTIVKQSFKDKVQLVLVLSNGDLRAVEFFDLSNEEEVSKLKEVIKTYEQLPKGQRGPHGMFEDYKFFWTDTNGVRIEVGLSLKEDNSNVENLSNQS